MPGCSAARNPNARHRAYRRGRQILLHWWTHVAQTMPVRVQPHGIDIAYESAAFPWDNGTFTARARSSISRTLLGEAGAGLRMLFHFLNRSRPSVAAHALGIARAAFDDAVSYINERVQSGRRVLENQGIQFMVADMSTDLALCERWLWHVAARIEAGEDNIGIEASMLKMRASDLAVRIATDAVQLLGGYGYTQDYRVERLMRDAKITQIWEGTNQIHRQLIGRSFLAKTEALATDRKRE